MPPNLLVCFGVSWWVTHVPRVDLSNSFLEKKFLRLMIYLSFDFSISDSKRRFCTIFNQGWPLFKELFSLWKQRVYSLEMEMWWYLRLSWRVWWRRLSILSSLYSRVWSLPLWVWRVYCLWEDLWWTHRLQGWRRWIQFLVSHGCLGKEGKDLCSEGLFSWMFYQAWK